MATPGQAVFFRYTLFNPMPVVYWQVVTNANQRQLHIDNVRESDGQVMHDNTIGDRVYVEITGI